MQHCASIGQFDEGLMVEEHPQYACGRLEAKFDALKEAITQRLDRMYNDEIQCRKMQLDENKHLHERIDEAKEKAEKDVAQAKEKAEAHIASVKEVVDRLKGGLAAHHWLIFTAELLGIGVMIYLGISKHG